MSKYVRCREQVHNLTIGRTYQVLYVDDSVPGYVDFDVINDNGHRQTVSAEKFEPTTKPETHE